MKKYLRLLSLTFVICTAALALWYTRPLSIPELCPAIDFEQCKRIHGYYYLYDGSNGAGDNLGFELTPDDNEFDALLATVEERKFHRSLRSLLPQTAKTRWLEDGDYKWNVTFTFEPLAFPDGSVGSGEILHINNFFGQLELWYDGESWQCSTDNQDVWIAQVMETILLLAVKKSGWTF